MAESKINLVKLHYEVRAGDITKAQARALWVALRGHIVRDYQRFKRLSDREYPVTLQRVMNLCRFHLKNDTYFIGLELNETPEIDKADYLKIEDVEYGVSGVEMRVVRRALEECLTHINDRGV